jgi:Ca2+-binding RTX toxin-like protein
LSTDAALGAAVLGDGKIILAGYSDDDGDLMPSAARLIGDTPLGVENVFQNGDTPPPEVIAALAPTSDSAKIDFFSQPDADGNVKIKTNNSGADVVTVKVITAGDGTQNYDVNINGTHQFYAVATTKSITIDTDGGNDVITADSNVTVELIVFAGDGNDKITGGGGRNLLFGQAGNDLINGGSKGDAVSGGSGQDSTNGNDGNDIVIGGANLDDLSGGNGEDILIPGTTSYDGDITALRALLDEWTSAHTNPVRITNIRNGTGLNSPFYFRGTGANKTVFDDGSKDKLTGGNGRDWFFRNKNGPNPDVLTDGLSSEEYDNV